MDLVGIGFILLFGVVGALVAYGADSLGRTLGKKRLTLFKLRPRHTAAVITTGAGFIIPIVTVLLVALLSSDVRTWLIEGRQAIATNQRLVRQLEEDSKSYRAELNDLQRQKDDLAKQTLTLTKAFDSQRTKLDSQTQEISANQVLLQQEKGKLATAQSQRQQAEGRLATITKKYSSLNKQYAKLETALQDQIKNLNANIVDINKELTAKEKRLKDARAELDTTVAEFDKQRINFETEVSKARNDLAQVEKARDEARTSLNTVQGEKTRIETELVNLRKLQAAAEAGLNANLRISRTQPLIFRGGEELARVAIAPGESAEDAKAHLNSLLRSARLVAEKRGSAPNGEGVTAGLVDVPMDNGVVTAQNQFDGLAKAVTGREDSSVLIAYAFWNGFQGEFLPLRIEAFQNPIVYPRGKVITEIRVDGTQPEEDILRAINEFIAKSVGQEAVRSGMIPTVGAEKPLAEIAPDAALETMREIKSARRTIRLLAVAAQDTRAADALKVEFRLR